jgi:hypothetical protein
MLPAVGALCALAIMWIAWRLGSGTGTLGGYEVVASTSYSVGAAAKFVVYHLASVLILAGLFPAAALVLLVVRAARTGEPDPRVRAFLAVACSLTAWFVLEVGVFASYYSDRVVERNLIGLGPVLFIGLVLWIERGVPGTLPERGAVAAAAAVVLLVLPVRRLVNDFGTHDAMTLVPLYKLLQASSRGTVLAVYIAVGAATALAFALLPRRAVRVVPAVLLVALVAASIVAARFVVDQAQAQQVAFLGKKPRWVDKKSHGSVAYLYDGEPSWNGVWETLFWNEHVDRVYDIGKKRVPGPLPQARAEVQPDGTIFVPPSARQPGPYAVASTWITLAGDKVKQIEQQGLTQAGLALWRLDPPLRMRDQISGLDLNGDIFGGSAGRFDAYDCTDGTFKVTLIVKQPQTIEVKLGDRVLKRLEFPSPKPEESWHGEFPVSGHRHDLCSFQVVPTGLLGTTVFEFDRGS